MTMAAALHPSVSHAEPVARVSTSRVVFRGGTMHGRKAEIFVLDVCKIRDIEKLRDFALERFGKVDILVNNAAFTVTKPAWDVTEDEWDLMSDTGFKGLFFSCQIIGSLMRKQRYGKIINLSSILGLVGSDPEVLATHHYVASKHGMQGLTGSINAEERRNGIRACVICPGEVDTPNLDLRPLPPSPEARVSMLLAEDIANAVAYVATQPERVAVELMVITPRTRRNYAGDYERYLADGHTKVETE